MQMQPTVLILREGTDASQGIVSVVEQISKPSKRLHYGRLQGPITVQYFGMSSRSEYNRHHSRSPGDG